MTRARLAIVPVVPQTMPAGGQSPEMQRVAQLCAKASRSALPVLIEGEAGTGKDTLARGIHLASEASGKPLVVVDCAALPWDRIEATLFGRHRQGGANDPGKAIEAKGGTLLINEVGELSASAQAGLMRLIETGEVTPEGAKRADRVSVRIIATSSQRLLNLARSGEFREDLFYRLNALPIFLPPLCQRQAELPSLCGIFATEFSIETGKSVTGISPEAVALIMAHDWPENFTELRKMLFRAVSLAEGRELQAVDFPQLLPRETAVKLTAALPAPSAPVHIDSAKPRRKQTEGSAIPDRFLTPAGEILPIARLERDLIEFAIAHHGGRMSRIARALGIGRSTLYRKVRDYGLEGQIRPEVA